MSWPLSHDYNEAIQNPKLVFSDPDLKAGEAVVGARGLPLPRSGNFADVYQIRGADGKDWAVKCFTRPVVGLAERYARVSEALEQAKLPFVVGFTFLAEGIRVGDVWRPAVKMEWVEGLLLNQVVRENAAKPQVLAALGQMWVRLCKRLREVKITHADLQHGNVLLVPGSRPGTYGLKLIDYDGMYVPALANQPSGEVGHPAYQHPSRAATRAYSPDLDRFPHLVALTALKGLEVAGSTLWDRYDTGDNLLFTEDDFRKPNSSKLMRELWRTDNPALQSLVGRLVLACGKPIPQTPWIDELAPEGDPRPLDNDTRHAAAAALGVAMPVPVALPPEPDHGTAPPQPVVVPLPPEPSVREVDVELVEERKAEQKPGRKTEQKPERKRPVYQPPNAKGEKSNSRVLLIAGGLLLLIGGVAIAIMVSGGKPDDTAQNPNDGDQNGGVLPKDKEPKNPKDKDTKDKEPKDKEPKEKDPKDKNTDPLPFKAPDLKPVGKLQVKERWTAELGTDPPAIRLVAGTDSRLIAVTGFSIGSFCLDAANGTRIPGSANKILPPIRGGIALDGGRFAAPQTRPDAPISIWNPKAQTWDEPLKPIAGVGATGGQTFVSRNARYLAFGGFAAQDAPAPFKLKDIESGEVILDMELVRGQAFFTADSGRVLVADQSGKCRWFQLPSGKPDGEWTYQRQNPGGQGPLTVSRSGEVVFLQARLPGSDAFHHLLDGRTGELMRSFPGPYMSQRGNPLSEDGRLVAFVTRGPNATSTIEVIETATGNTAARQTAPTGKEYISADLLPDGSAVVAVLGDPPEAKKPERQQIAVRYDLVPESVAPTTPSVPRVPLELKAKWESKEGVPANPHYFRTDPATDALVVGDYFTREVSRFDPKNGHVVGKPTTFPDSIGDITPLENGQYGLYVRTRGEVVVWDSKTDKEAGKIPVPELPLPAAAGYGFLRVTLSPNRKYLAVGRCTNSATSPNMTDVPFRIFDVATGKPLVSIDWRNGDIHFTADSSRVLVADMMGKFRWFKLPSGEEDGGWDFGQPPYARYHRVYSITPDGAVLAYNGPRNARDDTLLGPYALSGKTGEPLHRFKEGYWGSAVSISADGRRAAAQLAMDDGDVRFVVVDVASGTPLARVGVPLNRTLPKFVLSSDGLSLVVHDGQNRKLYGVEIPATFGTPAAKDPPVTYPPVPVGPGKLHPRWVASADVGREPARIHADPDADVVLVGSPVAGHVAFDLKTGNAHAGFTDLGRNGVAEFFQLDGGRMGTVTPPMAEVQLWDAKTGKDVGKVAIPEIPPGAGNAKSLRAVLSPDGKYLAVGRAGVATADNPDVPFRVFDTTTNKELVSVTWKGGSMHFTADSSRLLVAEWPGRVRWFKLPSGEPDGGWDFGPPPGGRRHLVYGMSGDGSVVAYKGPAGLKTNEAWPGVVNGKTGEVIRRLTKHYFASDVSISADGRRAALLLDVAADSCTFDVLDVATGSSLGTARLATGRAVPSFVLSPDGNSLFAHDSAANKLHRLDVPPPKSP